MDGYNKVIQETLGTDKLKTKLRILNLYYALTVFFITYNLTNLYADKLNKISDLPNIAGEIDSYIPFLDFMIIPYACSTPLFIAGFFIVNNQRQLTQLVHRLLLTTVFACLYFLWKPLQFSFNVDTVLASKAEIWQSFYHILHTVDMRYNQAPSLHVAYSIVITTTLLPALTSRYAKITLVTLSFLISISTLFTWQHHVLDLFGGLLLASIVLLTPLSTRN